MGSPARLQAHQRQGHVVEYRAILEQVSALGADDLLIALVSGGGSSLLSLPAEGVTMVDLKAVEESAAADPGDLRQRLMPPDRALTGLPEIVRAHSGRSPRASARSRTTGWCGARSRSSS